MAVVVHGFRGFLPAYPGGDLLYHWGLTHGLLRGEFPPGGPYEGLPAYYPPGYHIGLTLSTVLGTTVEAATNVLSIAWLPVLPLTTFLLTRYLTGRADVALLASILTVFGGVRLLRRPALGQQPVPRRPRGVPALSAGHRLRPAAARGLLVPSRHRRTNAVALGDHRGIAAGGLRTRPGPVAAADPLRPGHRRDRGRGSACRIPSNGGWRAGGDDGGHAAADRAVVHLDCEHDPAQRRRGARIGRNAPAGAGSTSGTTRASSD